MGYYNIAASAKVSPSMLKVFRKTERALEKHGYTLLHYELYYWEHFGSSPEKMWEVEAECEDRLNKLHKVSVVWKGTDVKNIEGEIVRIRELKHNPETGERKWLEVFCENNVKDA